MSEQTFNFITNVIAYSIVLALGMALVLFALLIVRWRTTSRRRLAILLVLSLAVVPCLRGVHQLVIWNIFLPAVDKRAQAEAQQRRADKIAQRPMFLEKTSVVHVGDVSPDFELTTIDGSKFSMSESNGKVVLINMFATWCGPCCAELPHIESIWKEFGEREDFRLLVIGREETDQTLRKFRSTEKFSFPMASDPDGDVFAMFAKESIPRTIIVSREGRIVYSQAGYMEKDIEELRSVLSQQLGSVKTASTH